MTTSAAPFVKLKNPYTFGVPVSGEETFFGREAEMRLIFDTLNNVPRGQKQDIVVLGPRRIGKSSLLRRLTGLLAQPRHDFVPVYIDLQAIQPRVIQTLMLWIAAQIRRGYADKGIADLPAMRVQDMQAVPPGLEFMAFNDDLADLNTAVAANDWPRLVLMFDEVEVLQDFGHRGILEWLRSLIQSLNYAVFVVSGSDQVYALTQDYGSPFYNIFKAVELFPLEPAPARALIEEPAARVGMRIEPRLVDKVLSYSGNNPYFIQGISHYLVEELNRQERGDVREEDVDRVIIACVRNLSAQFNYYWAVVTSVQKLLLYTLARVGRPQTAGELFDRVPTARTVLPEAQERRETFDRLVQQQVLREDAGAYWFVVPLFAEWLLATIKDDEIVRAVETLPTDAADGSGLRRLITLVYTDDHLLSLIGSYFPDLYDRISPTLPKPETINLLITHAFQNDRIGELARRVRQEFPEQYDAFARLIPLPEVAPPEPEVVPAVRQYTPDVLRGALSASFTIAELDQLAAELAIPDDLLQGTTKKARAFSLFRALDQQGRLDDLAAAIDRNRPGVLEQLKAESSDKPEEVDLVELRNLLIEHYTREELYDVAYELGVNPDSLPNASSGAFTREFLLFVTRRGMLPKLQKILKHDRPNVVWPWESSPPEASKQPDTTRLPYRIRSALSNEEFDELVFNLGIDRETLAGTSTLERIVSLVEWARRHGRTDDLMDALRAVRPQVDWTTDLLPGSEAA